MNAFDRCIWKIDKIHADLNEMRRYNQNTMLILIALMWGMVPAVLVVSILFVAWR